MSLPSVRKRGIGTEKEKVAIQPERAVANGQEEPPTPAVLKQRRIGIPEIPHQSGTLAPAVGKFVATVDVHRISTSGFRQHVQRSFMLKQKRVRKMIPESKHRLGSRRGATVVGKRDDGDVPVRLISTPLLAKNKPLLLVSPQERIRPTGVGRR